MCDKNWKKNFDSAWKRGGKSFVQSLLDEGFDVNALNKTGRTLLSYAAECGNMEIAEFLVQKGADANVACSDGSKPLLIAALYCRKEIVKFFLDIGISVDSCDEDKCTSLHYIVARSDNPTARRELVRILVDRDADLDAVDRWGCTPMLRAAKESRKHWVELFLQLGANPECCYQNQWTVLNHACNKGWSEIVRTLVKGRFEINTKTSKGYDAPLIIAAYSKHEDIVKLLIGSGADVKCKGVSGETMLHYACKNGWLEVMKCLVSKGCDLNLKDSSGQTPLLSAASCSDLSVVEYLIECGADVEVCDKYGNVLLHYACEEGWLGLVKCLVSKGCDLNAKNSRGKTPLCMATEYSHSSVVEYLIECGADVVSCNTDGMTVLHYACNKRWLEIVKLLIKKKCDVNARNHYLLTPLHEATCISNRLCCLEIIEKLMDAGADCNAESSFGRTAFYSCIQFTPSLEGIALFLQNGAYFQTNDYYALSENSYLKENVLQNTQLCTLALINKFNNSDLRKMYEIPGVSEKLPSIEKLKITSQSTVAQDIAEGVRNEIQYKGYCNVLSVSPIVLNRLCVLTLVQHYNRV